MIHRNQPEVPAEALDPLPDSVYWDVVTRDARLQDWRWNFGRLSARCAAMRPIEGDEIFCAAIWTVMIVLGWLGSIAVGWLWSALAWAYTAVIP